MTVTRIKPLKMALLERLSKKRFKNWVLVIEHDDEAIEVVPDGDIGPFVATDMLIEALHLIKEQWVEDEEPPPEAG